RAERCHRIRPTELLRDLRGVPLEDDVGLTRGQARLDILDRPYRQCLGQCPPLVEPRERRFGAGLNHPASDDESPPPPLWEAVMGCVHHAPFHEITEVGETREDDREITAPLCGW